MTEQLSGTRPIGASGRARVAIPFLLCTLIWSSTWLVIRTQLGTVPPSWSIAYRFAIAAIAMLGYAIWTRVPLRLSARQHGFAAIYGVAQYAFNYEAVYAAERTVTSGLVALVFALLVVPNALLAWVFLKQGVSRAFLLGSAVAGAGLVLLFWHELHASPAGGSLILGGVGWTIAGVLAASVANVMQAGRMAKAMPVVALVAWGMVWGSAFNVAVAWGLDGPPVFEPDSLYWLGTFYLGLIGSALAFTAYFVVIRAIGPARAAYSSVLIPVLAMALSTIFEGYRWSPEAAVGGLLSLAGLFVALQAKQSASPAR